MEIDLNERWINKNEIKRRSEKSKKNTELEKNTQTYSKEQHHQNNAYRQNRSNKLVAVNLTATSNNNERRGARDSN